VVEAVSGREELFRRADVVSLHVPATPETRGSVGMAEFRLMKPGAFFINTARGEIVVEEDLVTALQDGLFRGAGLDVFAEEPPAPDHPLLAMDQVIVTPHNAALTQEAMDRMGLHAAMGIVDVLEGREPQWPVNRPPCPRGR
jgi:D-3-phosphoglycerate dehydrogenase